MTTKRILAVLGDYYHNEKYLLKSLENAVQSLNGVTVAFTSVFNLVENLQSKPDVVILSAENRLNPVEQAVKTWMDADAEKAICNYVNEGGGWIAWHSGLASYVERKEYTSMLRGYFKYHPPKHAIVTYSADRTTGESFELLDEHYFVQCDVENTNVFLTSESEEGTSIAAWEHTYGDGQVVCLTPAHLEEGLLHPSLASLIANSIKLCCKL
jgi:type 1 glutamine amidotransferase